MRKSGLDSVGVDGLNDGVDGGSGSVLDGSDLVANSGQGIGQESDEIRLDVSGHLGVLSDSLDGLGSLLTKSGILRVGNSILQSLDSSDE